MKKTFVAIARPICRFIASALWQLIWLVPLWCACWYGKWALPKIIRAHFGVDQVQDKLTAMTQLADLMKNNTSLTNPTALVHYLSAQLSKFSLSTKINTLEIASNVLQTICIWGINLLWIAALIYAVIRTFRLYRAKSETYDTARAVAQTIQPQLLILQDEICALREEIQELKQEALPSNEHKKDRLLTHD